MGFFFSFVYGIKDVIQNQFSTKKNIKDPLLDDNDNESKNSFNYN